MDKLLSLKILTIMVVLILTFSPLFASDGGPAETVLKFFKASRNGDIKNMKLYIGGPYYEQRKVLLEDNKRYPDFLREYYKGSKIKILYTITGNDTMVKENHHKIYDRHYRRHNIVPPNTTSLNKNSVAIVSVKHTHENGQFIIIKLLLEGKNKRGWKIVNGILVK